MSIEEKLVEALNHIVWIPYCGIDGPDETGVYKNWPEEERDAMYKIAVETLIDVGLLSDNMKNAANRIKE